MEADVEQVLVHVYHFCWPADVLLTIEINTKAMAESYCLALELFEELVHFVHPHSTAHWMHRQGMSCSFVEAVHHMLIEEVDVGGCVTE